MGTETTRRRPDRLLSVTLVLGIAASSGGCAPNRPSGSPAPPPVAAAEAFLRLPSAAFEMQHTTARRGGDDRVDAQSTGAVDPAHDSGRLTYDFLPGFTPPNVVDIVWNQTDFWIAIPPKAGEVPTWQHRDRPSARSEAIMGRVQEEPLALIQFVVEAEPSTIEQLPPQDLDGVSMERWLVRVPVDDAKDAFVPPDSFGALRELFGISSLPVQVWLHEGRIARTGYELGNTSIPGARPDRIEVWYDWSRFGEPLALEFPPSGRVIDSGPAAPVASPSSGA